MSRTRKILTLSAEEIGEIERAYKINDPSEIAVEYLQAKVFQLEDLLEEYKGLKNAPEEVKVLGRKRIMLVAREIQRALIAPKKPLSAIINADERTTSIIDAEKENIASIIEC